jgi:hypothetical protein
LQLGFSSRGSWKGHAASREMRCFALRCEGRAAGAPSLSRLKRDHHQGWYRCEGRRLTVCAMGRGFPQNDEKGVGSHTCPPEVCDLRDTHPASGLNKTGTQACDRFASSRQGQKEGRAAGNWLVDMDALAACTPPDVAWGIWGRLPASFIQLMQTSRLSSSRGG